MSRNDLCACGSGKRVKHCHGALPSAAPSALHREALAAHRTGALRHAETLYRRALERDPGDIDSVHMLGVVQFERMRWRRHKEVAMLGYGLSALCKPALKSRKPSSASRFARTRLLRSCWPRCGSESRLACSR